MKHNRHADQCEYRLAPGGVELLSAHYRTQRFSKHFHEGYALGVITHGALAFRYRGENLVAAPGDINLTVPGEVHDGHAASDSGWAYRMFYLPGPVLADAARQLGKTGSTPYFPTAVLRDPELAGRIERVHAELSHPHTPTLARQSLLLSLLATWIARHAADKPAPRKTASGREAARRAADFIRDNLDRDVNLAELSQTAGLSPFHLIRVFAKHTGLTPHAFLTNTRLDRARDLLATPMRLAEIAAHAGFADQGHLTRLFKQRFGLTPGACRNFLQNNRA